MKEAVVIAIPDEMIGNRLIAQVVPLNEDGLTPKELEIHCSQRLPRYMVPESIRIRGELPKTSSGKINRQLLVSIEYSS